MALESGTTLGHYQVTAPIGKGGMGEVYRARDTKLGREVAIKVLPSEFAQDAERLARLEREARMLAALNHPNIAAIHGLEESDNTRFLVLELVEGDTLADRLERGAIPVEESLKLALQIAEALEAAHEKGVIHRDLKPSNVKVTSEGRIKVLDFGLAKAFIGDQSDANLSNSPTLSMAATQSGIILGTVSYMSPEQAKGRQTDKRTDIWSFGCVLYEMLSGRQAFGGDEVSEIIASVLAREPDLTALNPNLHSRLREVVDRCLKKDLKARFQDIGDVRVEMDRLSTAPESPTVQPASEYPTSGRRSKLAWVGAVALALVGGIAGWLLKPDLGGAVTRFDDVLPENRDFRNTGRPYISVAPDGSKFVYNAGGGLYLRVLGDSNARVISGTEEALTNPTFSPDGESLVYWSVADRQLKRISVLGGSPLPLTDVPANPFGLSWDEDETILYQSAEGILKVSADGGEPELLVPRSTQADIRWPQLLPGSSAILYATANQEIAVSSLDSEEPRTLFPGTRARYVPTGHIVYSQAETLYAVPFDLNSLSEVGGPRPVAEAVDGSQFAIADSGLLVNIPVSASLDGPRVLFVVDREGLRVPIDAPPGQYVSPRVSPDGRQLAVEVVADNGSSDIWIYDLVGETQPRNLTLGRGSNTRPIWTPDGLRVTYFSADRGEPSGIFWKNADGTGVEDRLTTAEEGIIHRTGSWHPDGSVLAFARFDPAQPGGSTTGMWVLDVERGEVELYYDVPGGNQDRPEFSQDGDWIAYNSIEPGASQFEIYIRRFPDTGEFHQITRSGEVGPMWTRSGRELFFRGGLDAGVVTPVSVIGAVEIQLEPSPTVGSRLEIPIAGFSTAAGVRNFDIMPDDQRLVAVFPADDEDGQEAFRPRISVTLNWFQELRERVPVN